MEKNRWDLSYIFESDEKWYESFDKSLKEIKRLDKYKNNITKDIDTFKSFFKEKEEVEIYLENLYVYAHLKKDEDTTNSKYQEMYSKIQSVYTTYYENNSYVINEYMDNEKTIREYLKDKDLEKYTHHFDEIFSEKDHILSKEEEKILASFKDVFNASLEIYSALSDSDLRFDDVYGEKLTSSNFILLLESKDRKIRQKAFENTYNKYKEYINTFAKTLATDVKTNNIMARLKKYKSARNEALSENFIDERIYDVLVETINRNLFRLHEYIDYRKEVLKLSEMQMYDMFVPTTSDFEMSFSIDEAKEILKEAFSPLGEEYINILNKAFDENWIDFKPVVGKTSGAYSGGGYKTKPYILMSYENNLDSLYTLAHELGHSIHSYYSRHTQEYTYSSYTLFLAEIASTTNENLLTHYLLKKYEGNKKAVSYILNSYLDGFKGTVFRQTQFAEFEQLIHDLDMNNEVLTADRLCEEYRLLNEKYYGPSMEKSDLISYEWARIPHFFYFFYVYQYAVGFSSAIYFANSIINGEKDAVKKYIGYLSSGCSKNSLEILKDAGLDILNDNIIDKALEDFSNKLEELKKL